jgi:hypothetical protein
MSVSALFRQFASCFFAELRRKSKDWLPRNQDNVSEWSDMYIRGLLFPLANTMQKKTKGVGLEKSGHHHHRQLFF